MSNVVDIAVPKSNSDLLGIKKGSAIVVSRQENSSGFLDVYYEGNLYGASNMNDFEGKLIVAGGRLRDKAPTVARMHIRPSEVAILLNKVGEYDLSTFNSTISNQAALDKWCKP